MTAIGRRLASFGRAPVPEWEELARAADSPPSFPALAQRLADNLPWLLLIPYAGLVVALVLNAPLWAGLAWLVAAGLDWASTRVDSATTRLLDLAGLRPSVRAALRSLLLLGTLAWSLPVVLYVVAAVVVQLAWAGLGALATWLWRAAPPLLYVPGKRVQPQPLRSYVRVYAGAAGTPGSLVVAEALAVIGALQVAGPASAWALAAVGALLALGYLVETGFEVRGLLQAKPSDTDSLLAELAKPRPRYLAYVSLGAGQSRYIVNQWLPVFDATTTNGLIAVREASQLKPLATTRVPVVYAPTTRHVEQLTLPGVRAALYLAYGEKNAHLLREPRLKHVMLLHGDSDKTTSANAMARAFDQVWVAGQAAIDRYRAAGVKLPNDRFVVIGRPQVEPLLKAAAPTGATSEGPVVLYAPTFEGYQEANDYTSLDRMGVDLVKRLLADLPQAAIWFKPHPSSGVVRASMRTAIGQIEQLLAAAPHVIVDRHPELGLVECLARADLLVSDISSVVTDYLATGRPVIVTNPAGLSSEEFHATYPSQQGLYTVGPDLAGFGATVAEALGDDPLQDERAALRDRLLGTTTPQAAFDTALVRLTSH